MAAKLKASLPKDESGNGIDYALAQEMVSNPRRQYVLVAYVSVAQIVQELAEDGTYDSPVLRIDAIECVGDQFDVPPAVSAAFRFRHQKRIDTGTAQLPGIHPTDDFGNHVDLDTGEIVE